MPEPLENKEDFDKAVHRINQANRYYKRKIANFWPRWVSKMYLATQGFLITGFVLGAFDHPPVGYYVFGIMSILMFHGFTIAITRLEDGFYVVGVSKVVNENLMREAESLQAANKFLRAELERAKRDS